MKKLQLSKNSIKWLLLICLCILFVGSIVGISTAEALAEENTQVEAVCLSQMSDEECIVFLKA